MLRGKTDTIEGKVLALGPGLAGSKRGTRGKIQGGCSFRSVDSAPAQTSHASLRLAPVCLPCLTLILALPGSE